MEDTTEKTDLFARRNTVTIFLNALDAAARSSRIFNYEGGQHSYESVLENTMGAFSNAMQLMEEIPLTVKPFEMIFERKSAYENKDKKRSLSYALYGDGIRLLVFRKGLEKAEIKTIIQILSSDFSRPEMMDEDLYCLFAEHALSHLDISGTDIIQDLIQGEPEIQEEMQSFFNAVTQRHGPKRIDAKRQLREDDLKILQEFQLNTTQFSRSDEEISKVIQSIIAMRDAGSRDRDMLSRLLSMGLHFLQSCVDVEQIHIGRDLIMKMGIEILEQKYFDLFQELILEINRLQKESSTQISDYEKILNFLFGVDQMKVYSSVLEDQKNWSSLVAIFLQGPPSSIVTRDPENDSWEQLVHLFSQNPTPLFQRFLSSLLTIDRPVVRLKILRLLVHIGTPQSLSVFRNLLKEGSLEVRKESYNLLSGGKTEAVLEVLLEHVQSSPIFEPLSQDEKIAAYSAILNVGGKSSLPWFGELWNKSESGILARHKKERERRLILVHVLARSYPEFIQKMISKTPEEGLSQEIQAMAKRYLGQHVTPDLGEKKS